MSRKLALILACGVLVSSFSFNAQALPGLSVPARTAAPEITLVRDWCGLGFYRGPYGYCHRNGTVVVPPMIVAPSPVIVSPSPVVVAPAVQVVVPPLVCPYGYVLGPYGHCLPY